MEHTDEQKRQLKEAFAKKRRNRWIAMALIVPSAIGFGFGAAGGVEGEMILGLRPIVWWPVVLVVFVGSIIFSVLNWRCPACGTVFGIHFDGRHCPGCGVELQ
jgi:hypothetical protein